MRSIVIGVALAVIVIVRLLALSPGTIERFVAPVSGAIGRLLGRVSSVIPGSLAELLAAALVVSLIALAVRGMLVARAGERTWMQVLAGGALNVLLVGAVLGATFYLAWGVNYFRPPLAERLGWSDDRADLERVCTRLVDQANAERAAAGAGRLDRIVIDSAVEAGYARAVSEYVLPEAWAMPRPPAKPLVSSPAFSRFGVSGIYIPWTGEASFNRQVPYCELPHTLAHEKAHQRGVATEDEAEFAGFLAAIESTNPWVRYSAALWAQRLLLGELYRIDPEGAQRLVALRSPAVQRDIDDARAHWAGFRGPLRTAGRTMNDGYLKLQGVESGVESYRDATKLLLRWAARQDDAPE